MAKKTEFERELDDLFEVHYLHSGNTYRNVDEGSLGAQVGKFLKSDTSAADLARNPSLYPLVAQGLQHTVNVDLRRGDGVVREKSRGGAAILPGTSFAFEFHTAQQTLRQDFSSAETDRQFGDQNVLSRSSTVGPSGVRTPISGQGASGAPTVAERDAIAQGFRTPLELLIMGGSSNARTQPGPSTVGPRDPTIVSGGGIKRRKSRGAPQQTILTSDSDQLSGRTLLG
jgi:hypothetical protein